jgi:hypothetical protein
MHIAKNSVEYAVLCLEIIVLSSSMTFVQESTNVTSSEMIAVPSIGLSEDRCSVTAEAPAERRLLAWNVVKNRLESLDYR